VAGTCVGASLTDLLPKGAASTPQQPLLHNMNHHHHEPHHVARVGKPAPDFTAEAVVGQEFKTIKLSGYRGE